MFGIFKRRKAKAQPQAQELVLIAKQSKTDLEKLQDQAEELAQKVITAISAGKMTDKQLFVDGGELYIGTQPGPFYAFRPSIGFGYANRVEARLDSLLSSSDLKEVIELLSNRLKKVKD